MGRKENRLGADGLRLLSALECIKMQDRPALVCIAGASGSGKSFLGKYIRKGGLPGLPMRQVAVIDDGVMTRNLFWGFLRPKVKFPYKGGQDDLSPFFPFIPSSVRFVFFVCSTPLDRISHCDLLIVLHCEDGMRRSRLFSREGGRAVDRLQREKNLDAVIYPNFLTRVDVNSADLFEVK